MSKLSKDNRDNEAMEECYIAEIQALRKRIKELEEQVVGLKENIGFMKWKDIE